MTPPTLIVIDVQRAFDDPSWGERNNPGAGRRIAHAIAGWRERGAPLIHVHHRSAEPQGSFVPDTDAFEFKPEAQPLDGEPIITKDVNSAFIGTDATFARRTPDGELIAADDIHRVELASLHDEFAEVLSTEAALARLDAS